MNGVVFAETLRRGWRTALYWGIGLAFYALYILLVFGGDESARAQMADIMATKMPGFLGQMFGIPDDVGFLMSTAGFLSFAYFTYASLMLSVWAVLAGLGVTSNDEESGVMNMLLALPIPRWRVVVERIAGNIVLLIGIAACSFVGLLISIQAINVTDVEVGGLVSGLFGMVLVVSVVVAVTELLSVIVKRRGKAAALAGGFVAVSFLLNTLGNAAQSSLGDGLRNISVFYHFDSAEILQHGLALGSVTTLVVALAVVTWSAVQLFQKRDIGG
jgi:ABC-2 type transport system permease protein